MSENIWQQMEADMNEDNLPVGHTASLIVYWQNKYKISEKDSPIPSNGEKVYRWVRCNERLPADNKSYPVQWTSINGQMDNLLLTTRGRMEELICHELDLNVEWLELIPAPLDQPGIDREENKDEIRKMAEAYANSRFAHQSFRWQHMVRIYADAINEWIVSKIRRAEIQNEDKAPYSMPQKTYPEALPVSAVNAPTEIPNHLRSDIPSKEALAVAMESLPAEEIPEEIKNWIENNMPVWDAASTNTLLDAWEKGAIAIYHKLHYDHISTIQALIADQASSLSSIKGELDSTMDSLLSATKDRDSWKRGHQELCVKFEKLAADRDLYRKESEDLRKELELANEDRAGKNIQIADYKDALKANETANSLPVVHKIASYVLNKYKPKEGPKS